MLRNNPNCGSPIESFGHKKRSKNPSVLITVQLKSADEQNLNSPVYYAAINYLLEELGILLVFDVRGD